MESIRPSFASNEIIQSLKTFPIDLLKFYPRSLHSINGIGYGLIRTREGKKLVVIGDRKDVLKDAFRGKCYHQTRSLKLCNLSPGNAECLMNLFPFTKPASLRKYPMTIGMRDPLGMAIPGYIRVIEKFQVHPVLSQQSARENVQTRRNFTEVLQDAAWGVFQENYQEGYGANSDPLKSLQEVKEAINSGVSMVTLDLSGKMNPRSLEEPKELIDRKFNEEIDEGDAKVIFHLFLDKEFVLKGSEGEISIQFDEESVKRNTLLFYKALDFTEEVYEWIQSQRGNRGPIDFEISMDEILFPTSPQNHFFFALELRYRGVHIQSLTPRFTGEFQRDIDDHEDREDFHRQFYQHFLIAQDYGNYKISIHSRIDKLSFLSNIGNLSKGFFHLKTTGTGWLEAMRLIAFVNPSLYREIHSFILFRFKEASNLYHEATHLSKMISLEELNDQELPSLLDHENFRQFFCNTNGYLLNVKDQAGKHLFRDKLYHILTQHEEDYWSLLEKHIEKYLKSFGVKKLNHYS